MSGQLGLQTCPLQERLYPGLFYQNDHRKSKRSNIIVGVGSRLWRLLIPKCLIKNFVKACRIGSSGKSI